MKNLSKLIVVTFVFCMFYVFNAFAGEFKIDQFSQNEIINEESLYFTDNQVCFTPQGKSNLELIKNEKEYIINIYMDLTPSKKTEITESNNKILKDFCNIICSNGDELYNFVMDDYINKIIDEDVFFSTDYGVEVKVTVGKGILTYAFK